MTPFVAEILGTMFLIILGCGVVANVLLNKTNGSNSGWIVITTGWALAVFVGVTVAGPYSGAHINPAVTISLAITGAFSWSLVPTYIAAQFIGSMTGAFLIWLTYRDHFDATEDGGLRKAVYCTSPAIRNIPLNFFSEVIGTFVLVFVVLYITGASIESGELIGLGSVGAIPVAFLVWAIGLSLGGTTGYAINPARDLGPRIMHALLPSKGIKESSDWGYAWVPVIGSIVGGALAAGLSLVLGG